MSLPATPNPLCILNLVFHTNGSIRRLLVTANTPSSLILITLMMVVLRSYETSALTRATWQEGILQFLR
jgi:hypothetical protein